MKDNLMVQQQVKNVWQHMVGVICLNQTGRKKVKKILPKFFQKFPTPEYIFELIEESFCKLSAGRNIEIYENNSTKTAFS